MPTISGAIAKAAAFQATAGPNAFAGTFSSSGGVPAGSFTFVHGVAGVANRALFRGNEVYAIAASQGTTNVYWGATSGANPDHVWSNNSGTERLRLTDAGLLAFGGATSSFPAWKRSAISLIARLADDSADAALGAAYFAASSAAPTVGAGQVGYGGGTQTTVGAAGGASAPPATPTGYVIINVAGTDRVFAFYDKT